MNHDEAINQIRRRISIMLMLRAILPLLAGWCFLWGTAILFLRVLADAAPLPLLGGLAAVPMMVIAGVWLGLRRLPSKRSVRALVDRSAHCGGLLLAAEEKQLGAWEHYLPPAPALRLRWQWRRPAVFLGAAVLFVAAGLLLPLRSALIVPGRTLQIGKETQELAKQIDLLKNEKIMKPERADELKKELAEIKKNATGKDPEKTFDALDHLQDLVRKSAASAGEKSVQQTETMAKAKTLAEALRRAGKSIDNKMNAEAMAELARLVKRAKAESERLGKRLDRKSLQRLNDGEKLTDKQLKQLEDLLEQSKQELANSMERLQEYKLIDAELLKRLIEAGKCDGEGMAMLMEGEFGKAGGGKGDGKMSIAEMLARLQGQPGRGGLTRGRGDAPMIYGKESSEQGVKFKAQILPPSAIKSLKDSYQFAETATAPDGKTAKQVPATAGVVQGNPAGKGSAVRQVILPQHRGTVRRYFARQDGKK